MKYFLGKMRNLRHLLVFFFILGASHVMARGEIINRIVQVSSSSSSSREDDQLVHNIAGYGENKLSTVIIIGQVLCHTRMDEKPQFSPQPVSGASVAVFCGKSSGRKRKAWGESRSSSSNSITDAYGEFLIDVPSHLHAIPNIEKICDVRVVRMPKKSICGPGKHKTQRIKLSSIRLHDDGNDGHGIRIYTSHRIHLTPKSSRSKHTSINNSRTKRHDHHKPPTRFKKVAAH